MNSCACVICALVLKDSDYLSVLFHLYDSDDDDEAERHKLAQLQRDERRRSVFVVYPPTSTLRRMHDDLTFILYV